MIQMAEHPTTSLGNFFRNAEVQRKFRAMCNAPEEVTASDKRERLDAETYELYERHKRGETISAISADLGLTPTAIRMRFLRRRLKIIDWHQAVPKKPRSADPKVVATVDRAIEMIDSGESIAHAAKEVGMKYITLYKHIEKRKWNS